MMSNEPLITRINIMGDSLSDAGTMNQNAFMRVASKVSQSPEGKFTNGMVWSDYLLRNLSNSHGSDNTRDVDSNHHKNKLMEGETVIRSYAIGGATSHETSADWNKSIERKLLSSLETERKELLKDNRKYHVNSDEIKTTLTVEWSGANDIATLSSKLENGDLKGAKKQADRAIEARLHNVEKLIEAGYTNFALFNLPNLANTPRFSDKKAKVTNGANEVSHYFNDKLLEGIEALQKNTQVVTFNVLMWIRNLAKFTQIPKVMVLIPIPNYKPTISFMKVTMFLYLMMMCIHQPKPMR